MTKYTREIEIFIRKYGDQEDKHSIDEIIKKTKLQFEVDDGKEYIEISIDGHIEYCD